MVINFFVRISAVILQILSNYLLVYILTSEGFSVFSHFMSMVLVLSIFSRLGLPVILVRDVIDAFDNTSRSPLLLQIVFIMVSSVILSVMVVVFSWFWFDTYSMLLLIFPVIITNGTIFLSTIYRGLGNGALSLTIETIIRPLSIVAVLCIQFIFDINNILILIIGSHFFYMFFCVYLFKRNGYHLIFSKSIIADSSIKKSYFLEYLQWLKQKAYPLLTAGLFKNSNKIIENFAILMSGSFFLGPAFLKIFLLIVLVSRTLNGLLLITFSKDIRLSFIQGKIPEFNRKLSLFAMYDFIVSAFLFVIILCMPNIFLMLVPNEELHTVLIYVQIYSGVKFVRSIVGNYNIWLGVLGLDNKIFVVSVFLNISTLFFIYFSFDLKFIFAALIFYDLAFSLIGIFVVKKSGIVSDWWLRNLLMRH